MRLLIACNFNYICHSNSLAPLIITNQLHEHHDMWWGDCTNEVSFRVAEPLWVTGKKKLIRSPTLHNCGFHWLCFWPWASSDYQWAELTSQHEVGESEYKLEPLSVSHLTQVTCRSQCTWPRPRTWALPRKLRSWRKGSKRNERSWGPSWCAKSTSGPEEQSRNAAVVPRAPNEPS